MVKKRQSKVYEDKAEIAVPYSLIVSLDVDGDIDIYSSVAQQVDINVPRDVEMQIQELRCPTVANCHISEKLK